MPTFAPRNSFTWVAALVALAAALACPPVRAADSEQSEVATDVRAQEATGTWRVDYASGVLWKFTGSATPLSYTLLPQIISVVSRRIGTLRPLAGGYLVLRNRFSAVVEPIVKGPEHHYFGGNASGLLEWWDGTFRRCLFFSAGGGAGWLDSKGQQIAGAQGENFNFNWFIYSGMRFNTASALTAGVGIYFQHISNTGFNKINPGLNALGPEVDVGWKF